jgi:hypothetical protein
MSIVNGSDDVINLVNSIEDLYAKIWAFGLHNLSNEVLGYATKMNQLKVQEVKINELIKELEIGKQLKGDIEIVRAEVKQSQDEITLLVSQAKTDADGVAAHYQRSNDVLQATTALQSNIDIQNTAISKLAAESKLSAAEITSMKERITEFFGLIDQHKTDIATTKSNAEGTIKANTEATNKLIKNLGDLEDQIKEQITRATGHSLFHSFQTRQGALLTSKLYWLIALGVLVAVSVAGTIYLATTTTQFNSLFFLKLSFSLPLIYAIAFCSVQYTRERKLEEEYAFKSNISISLVPYKDLVEKLVGDNPEEKAKFTSFIIESVNKVFTSPTKRVFDGDKRENQSAESIKQVKEMINAVVEPLRDFVRK